ncbi:hypothetical protein [Tenacibaculum mesophilum]|uniref:hypothetical protein n=1 Tax=Tenacibaculum mesophilum TaxID=104268 RepID=UPI00064A4DD6|nr:hypothetical protein [Tenacibaculum mesophilum]
MAEIKTYGLQMVKVGDPTVDGTFPLDADMSELCKTYKNSCEFVEEDPTITDEYSDQQDDPIHTFFEKGSKTIKFSTYDYSPTTLLALKGGTVLNDEWSEPVSQTEIVKAIQLVLNSGNSFKFPKARITAKFNAKLVKNGLSLLDVTIKPLSPASDKPAVIFG